MILLSQLSTVGDNLVNCVRQELDGIADLTPSSLVKWVNISEPSCLARFFRCLVFR